MGLDRRQGLMSRLRYALKRLMYAKAFGWEPTESVLPELEAADQANIEEGMYDG